MKEEHGGVLVGIGQSNDWEGSMEAVAREKGGKERDVLSWKGDHPETKESEREERGGRGGGFETLKNLGTPVWWNGTLIRRMKQSLWYTTTKQPWDVKSVTQTN